MIRKSLVFAGSWAVAVSFAAAADLSSDPVKLSAAQIVEKNVAARGGLEAWRAVQTMTLSGKLGAGGNQRATLQTPNNGPAGRAKPGEMTVPQRPVEEVQLPFVMKLERPRKMRFELEFAGQTALQVFDGTNGWKLRPFLGRRVVEPYTADEMKTTSKQADLDGPLVDYAAKGSRVELAGVEQVEGRDNYKIKLTLKSGESLHVWIDTQTFLETKMEGQPRRLDGTDHPVEVYLRDYRNIDGLEIPFVLETKVLPVGRTALGFKDPPVPVERTRIEKVVVNPKLEEAQFAKPDAEVASNAKRQ
ncbi:MAG TPA: hypothetical protein VKU02_15310 [Gemmataceae bacterium]|nr:hypothetical protein [Gemmataceae bacterium]